MVLAGVALVGFLTMTVGVPAHAGTVTYDTPSGSSLSPGGPVDAEAVFSVSSGIITITLTNLEVNPSSVAQNLSNLAFTVSNGSLTGASLTSSSGQEITVNSGGTYTTGATVAAGWVPTLSGTSGLLNDLSGSGHAGPAHTIIGAPGAGNEYTNANGSIAGNGAHNPFLDQTVTFTITGAGITADTTITSATFSFGTGSGVSINGVVSVPEPSSLVLGTIGVGLVASVGLARRRRRS